MYLECSIYNLFPSLTEATIEHSSSTSKNVKENYDSSSGASEAPKGSHSEEKQPKPKELKSIVQNNSGKLYTVFIGNIF